MLVTFTNTGSEDTYISTLYREIKVGDAVTAQRSYADLDGEQELKKQIAAGDITITTTAEDGDGAGVGPDAVKRVLNFADSDVAVAAVTAAIDLGGILPGGAVVVGIYADNTEDWDDGAAGTFSMDVGNAADPNKYTATAIDIDNGVFVDNRAVYIPADGDTLRVTITGSANLDTLVSGNTELTIYYYAASLLLETAP